jgi:hypothetical protein
VAPLDSGWRKYIMTEGSGLPTFSGKTEPCFWLKKDVERSKGYSVSSFIGTVNRNAVSYCMCTRVSLQACCCALHCHTTQSRKECLQWIAAVSGAAATRNPLTDWIAQSCGRPGLIWRRSRSGTPPALHTARS